MNRVLSLILCSAFLVFAVEVPQAHASSNACKSQKSALTAQKKKERTASSALSKSQRTINTLERQKDSQLRRVEKASERTDTAVTREEERTAKIVDRYENQRLNNLAQAAELTAQAAACVASGLLNDLLGTNLDCNASARNQLVAQAAQLTGAAGKLELRISSEIDRRNRKVDSIRKLNARKITTEQQKYDRLAERFNAESARLPALDVRATAENTALETAQANLDQCLALN